MSRFNRGWWWSMACWNGLDANQQATLIEVGTLPLGYLPLGECPNGARVAIELEDDAAPGPRFYCLPCAIEYLQMLRRHETDRHTKEEASE